MTSQIDYRPMQVGFYHQKFPEKRLFDSLYVILAYSHTKIIASIGAIFFLTCLYGYLFLVCPFIFKWRVLPSWNQVSTSVADLILAMTAGFFIYLIVIISLRLCSLILSDSVWEQKIKNILLPVGYLGLVVSLYFSLCYGLSYINIVHNFCNVTTLKQLDYPQYRQSIYVASSQCLLDEQPTYSFWVQDSLMPLVHKLAEVKDGTVVAQQNTYINKITEKDDTLGFYFNDIDGEGFWYYHLPDKQSWYHYQKRIKKVSESRFFEF